MFEELSNLTGPDANGVITYDIAVTGGTGRFEGATGSAAGTSTLVPIPTPVNVLVFTSTFSGTISY